jgi:hypothetical protein
MMNRDVLAFAFAALSLFAACGPNHNGQTACDQDPKPAGCDQVCDSATPCPDGYYCNGDGKCDQQCSPNGAQCPDGQSCTVDGRCEATDAGGPLIDADCPRVHFTATQVIPSIQILIDGSGSMAMSDIDPNRYDAVVTGLVGANGVVNGLEGQVYFGASIFTSTAPCPTLDSVGRALNNATNISNLITGFSPTGRTPTAPSIDAVVADFAANPPPAGSPPIIVLATDGEPNSCSSSTTDTGPSITAAGNAYAAGIRLYILGLSGLNTTFLQDMANAGVGAPAGTDAPYFTADDPTSLHDAFAAIIGGVLSCDLTLSQSISQQQASQGTVTLNGTTLTLGTDWTLLPDGTTIELQGAACDTLKSTPNPVVDASFPCGVIIP